jgi:hypothetical protein
MGCQKTTTKKMTANRPINLHRLPINDSGLHLDDEREEDNVYKMNSADR